MSSATELYVSRVGGIRGQHGAQGLTTTWHVITDTVDQDPVDDVLADPDTGSVVLGSRYPWPAFNVVATGFVVRDRLAPLSWLVDVIYGTPLVFVPPNPIVEGWAIQGGSSLATEEYIFDRTRDPDTGDLKPRVVAFPLYKPWPEENQGPPPFVAGSSSGNLVGLWIENPKEFGPIRPQQRQVGVSWITLTRIVRELNETQMGIGNNAVGKTNSEPFLGAALQQLFVSGFNFQTVQTDITEDGIGWEIRFDFEHNEKKFTNILVHTRTDPANGGEYPITLSAGDPPPEVSEFFPYDGIDIAALLANFPV